MPRVESGVAVESGAETTLQRWRLSWEEYLALPDDLRADWVDGEVVVSPRPSFEHGSAVASLAHLVLTHLPRLQVTTETGLWLPRNRLRGPDLMVVTSRPTERWMTAAPVLVVEVLSPSTRVEDTVRKSAEYAEAGIGHFWVIDPEAPALEAFTGADGVWEPLLRLDAARPTGEVAVGDHGIVPLDLREIVPGRFADPS